MECLSKWTLKDPVLARLPQPADQSWEEELPKQGSEPAAEAVEAGADLLGV